MTDSGGSVSTAAPVVLIIAAIELVVANAVIRKTAANANTFFMFITPL
jgi:hypothetical protein